MFPKTSSSASTARFFFAALGLQAIGYSPFGLDYTRTPAPQPGAATAAQDSFLQPTAQNYRLIGPMMRDIARLNFEGKLQAVAEEQGKPTQTLHFGDWDAFVTYGAGRGAAPRQGIRADRTRPGRATEGQPVSGHRISTPTWTSAQPGPSSNASRSRS